MLIWRANGVLDAGLQVWYGKLSKVVGIFKKLKKFLPTRTLLLMYNSLFLSHLNYCILVWGFSCDRIFMLQKKVIRLICNARYNAHTDSLFKQLNILKVHDILQLKALKFYYRYTKCEVPSYFDNMFEFTYATHTHFTRSRGRPILPAPKKTSLKKCIRFYIPHILQTSPLSIKDKVLTHSYFGFSKYTKSYFVNKYKDECTIPNCYVCNSSWTSVPLGLTFKFVQFCTSILILYLIWSEMWTLSTRN